MVDTTFMYELDVEFFKCLNITSIQDIEFDSINKDNQNMIQADTGTLETGLNNLNLNQVSDHMSRIGNNTNIEIQNQQIENRSFATEIIHQNIIESPIQLNERQIENTSVALDIVRNVPSVQSTNLQIQNTSIAAKVIDHSLIEPQIQFNNRQENSLILNNVTRMYPELSLSDYENQCLNILYSLHKVENNKLFVEINAVENYLGNRKLLVAKFLRACLGKNKIYVKHKIINSMFYIIIN